jgi:hypothetical protein
VGFRLALTADRRSGLDGIPQVDYPLNNQPGEKISLVSDSRGMGSTSSLRSVVRSQKSCVEKIPGDREISLSSYQFVYFLLGVRYAATTSDNLR